MYKCINGWTKAKMLKVIEARRYNVKAVGSGVLGGLKTCLYSTSNGNRCAVGLFIPDGHKALKHIGPVNDLVDKYPELENKFPLELNNMIVFQEIHDECEKDGNAKQKMIDWVKKNVEE